MKTADPNTQTGPEASLSQARLRLLRGLPVREHRLELAGVSTALLEGGRGPSMVLLHGPGEHAPKWFRVIPALVKTHHLIIPDLPGHGASQVREGRLEAAQVLAWLEELLERTCSPAPVLVGQILGGAIAARFAARRGARLNRLVLCDTLGLQAFQPRPEFGQALQEFLQEPETESHDRLWQKCAFDLDRLRSSLGESWTALKSYNLEGAQRAHLSECQDRLMQSFGLPAIAAEELARIRVPTFLIWGRHDLATPLKVAEAAAARYGWPLRVIEEAADDPPLEQPEDFLKALAALLNRKESTS